MHPAPAVSQRRPLRHPARAGLLLAAAGICLACALGAQAEDVPTLAQMQTVVRAATRPAAVWTGPRSGPAAAPDKNLVLIAEDLRNGGVLGVTQGVREAAAVIGWKLRVLDAGGSPAGRYRAMAMALAASPDGIILAGMDARVMEDRLQEVARRKIPIVGWHVGPKPGPQASPIAMNVATDPLEVARVAAMAAVVAANGRANVTIFTDSNFEIALAKSAAMADVIRACSECTLLGIHDVAISSSAERVPPLIRSLLARHGRKWTHALAINDIYFDHAVPELSKAAPSNGYPSLLSAGDGSASAFMRIRARTFQAGTVAEPLTQHGWQLIDEMNRLLSGQPVSGYIAPTHLVTADNIAADGGQHLVFDPDNAYRDIYRSIWQR
jgi:ribose transport system substrate-binding protein